MMHPRRLKGSAHNVARYYAVGDYYTNGTAEGSSWGGALAVDLGLKGEVDPQTFQTLLEGRVAGQQLGRHREGGIQHHPGWDFAISAPKSVSILGLVYRNERILEAHERAVNVALSYLEEHAGLRRRDEGQIQHETTGRLLYARFTEHASRELDPHLHTHVVVLNMTNYEPGGPMASLETRAMFAEQMVAGQIYRNELAHHLREQGWEIDFNPRTGLFEIADMPRDLMADMSRRSEQIDRHAAEHGLTGQAARRRSFYATRGPKQKVGLDELHGQWLQRASAHAKSIHALHHRVDRAGDRSLEASPAQASRAALFGLRQSEGREAVNNLGHLIGTALAAYVGEVRLSDVRPRLEDHEQRLKLLATRQETGDHVMTRGRTSRQTVRLEQALSGHIALSVDDSRPVATRDRLLAVLDKADLAPAQEQALVDIAVSRDRVTGLHGVAGSGKSTLVKALKDAADSLRTFVAIAPTSSAAANLGQMAGIDSRTVASLLHSDGRGLTDAHVLVLDEAGQLGNRQALRMLEISQATGARLILLGDNKQTGAIEQGKAFWLLQKLGLPTAQLTESHRQQTRTMKAAVSLARTGDYAGSIDQLDKVVSGMDAGDLGKALVSEWTRLRPRHRAHTNILVLDNATRLIVNGRIRETLKREGVVAAEDVRLQILAPSGMSDQQKQMARFYSGGQVVTFGRGNAALGLADGAEYQVLGKIYDAKGRQLVRLIDEHGRVISWDPRLGKASRITVFNPETRSLAVGDRLQWRLVSRELGVKNAERGTVERLTGPLATIRWDRDGRVQTVDLKTHKTWDHGYAETVYSAQSKTYARAYVLAPAGSPLVTGQNYYTAITRAQFGVKLWTEDVDRLISRLDQHSGEKTSALEGLGRIDRDTAVRIAGRNPGRLRGHRAEQALKRRDRAERMHEDRLSKRSSKTNSADRLADRVRGLFETFERHALDLLVRNAPSEGDRLDRASTLAEQRDGTGIERPSVDRGR